MTALAAPAATRTPNHSPDPDAKRPDHPHPNLTTTPISAPGLLRRLEGQCDGVDAVALGGRASINTGPVVEDVTEMSAAVTADDLGAAHEQAVVRAQLDRFGHRRLCEARPARARVELGVSREQHRRAGRAAEIGRAH